MRTGAVFALGESWTQLQEDLVLLILNILRETEREVVGIKRLNKIKRDPNRNCEVQKWSKVDEEYFDSEFLPNEEIIAHR